MQTARCAGQSRRRDGPCGVAPPGVRRRCRALPPPAAAAAPPPPTCHLAPLSRTLEFPHRGSGLLWARSTGLKLWPGAVLLSRALAERDGAMLAALHAQLLDGGSGDTRDATSSYSSEPLPTGDLRIAAAAAQPSVPAAAAQASSPAAAAAASEAAAAWGGWRDKAVLELGCGLGLVSSTAAWLGARVVATDGDADLLRVRLGLANLQVSCCLVPDDARLVCVAVGGVGARVGATDGNTDLLRAYLGLACMLVYDTR